MENNHKTNFLEDVEILENRYVGGDNFLMKVKSKNTQDSKIVPKAGQFYMLKLKIMRLGNWNFFIKFWEEELEN